MTRGESGVYGGVDVCVCVSMNAMNEARKTKDRAKIKTEKISPA